MKVADIEPLFSLRWSVGFETVHYLLAKGLFQLNVLIQVFEPALELLVAGVIQHLLISILELLGTIHELGSIVIEGSCFGLEAIEQLGGGCFEFLQLLLQLFSVRLQLRKHFESLLKYRGAGGCAFEQLNLLQKLFLNDGVATCEGFQLLFLSRAAKGKTLQFEVVHNHLDYSLCHTASLQLHQREDFVLYLFWQ
jgi:hypothetical protein